MFSVVVSHVRQLTPQVFVYQLRDSAGAQLPLISAGAYLSVAAPTKAGAASFREYPICSDPACRESYDILVDEQTQCGAKPGHSFGLNMRLECELVGNHFQLHADPSPSILIAEGLGIAAIKPLVHTLVRRGRRLQLHYAGTHLESMAFNAEIEVGFGNRYCLYPADQNQHLDMGKLLAEAPHNALFYVAGSREFIAEVVGAAATLGVAKDRIQSDCVVIGSDQADKPVVLELVRSNKLIQVAADQPLLAALQAAGIEVDFDCCVGECGSCACKVVAGDVEHRDSVLSEAARARGMMCVCVSRARSETLVLDL